jgi:translation elongation factor EF-Ts
MHSAGMNSQFISRQAMPQAALEAARADLASATEAQMPGKPAEVLAKIVDGKVAKWCKDVSDNFSGRLGLCALLQQGLGA